MAVGVIGMSTQLKIGRSYRTAVGIGGAAALCLALAACSPDEPSEPEPTVAPTDEPTENPGPQPGPTDPAPFPVVLTTPEGPPIAVEHAALVPELAVVDEDLTFVHSLSLPDLVPIDVTCEGSLVGATFAEDTPYGMILGQWDPEGQENSYVPMSGEVADSLSRTGHFASFARLLAWADFSGEADDGATPWTINAFDLSQSSDVPGVASSEAGIEGHPLDHATLAMDDSNVYLGTGSGPVAVFPLDAGIHKPVGTSVPLFAVPETGGLVYVESAVEGTLDYGWSLVRWTPEATFDLLVAGPSEGTVLTHVTATADYAALVFHAEETETWTLVVVGVPDDDPASEDHPATAVAMELQRDVVSLDASSEWIAVGSSSATLFVDRSGARALEVDADSSTAPRVCGQRAMWRQSDGSVVTAMLLP